jgi:TRAP-type uncharacterized transport system substrate-binding protein
MNTFDYLKLILIDEYLALKELLIEQSITVAAVLFVVIASIIYFKPFPPHSVTMAVGPPGTPSYVMAQELTKIFENDNIALKFKDSVGSVESIHLLEDPNSNVDIGLIVSGTTDQAHADKFYSLGSVAYSPVWIFYRKDLKNIPKDMKDLSRLKLRVGIGPEGGATVPLSKKIFALNGIDISKETNFRVAPYAQDVEDLMSGKIDCAIIVSTYYDWDIQKLLREPTIGLMGIDNTRAYEISVPYLQRVVLPEGSVNLERNIPSKDIPLISPTLNIVVKKDLNPDIQIQMLTAAKEFLYTTEYLFFSRRGEFPAYVDTSIPISPVALDYYTKGPPARFSYLPFWLAGFVNRSWLFFLALIAVLYPIAKLNLQLRTIRFHVKQHRFFDELHEIERELNEGQLAQGDKPALLEKIQSMRYQVSMRRIPIGMEESHFNFVNALYLIELRVKEI